MNNLKWKPLVALLLGFTLLMGLAITAYADNTPDEILSGLSVEEKESLQKYDETYLVKQSKALENYTKLQEKIVNTNARKNNFISEEYGGAYTDDDGNLVVYLKSVSENLEKQIYEIDSDIIIKPCQYSYVELTNTMNRINEFKLNGEDDFANKFNYFKLSDSSNRIIVEFDELTDENIAEFKRKVTDDEMISFAQSKGEDIEDVSLKPGAKISKSGSSASIGYRVKRNNVVGIVTAAHFASSGDSISHSGTTFGTCKKSVYSGAVDAAFIEVTNSNYTPSNTIDGTSNVLSRTISEPGVGTVINKRGMKTGATSGKVISTNATWTINGVTFTNLTSADYTSDSGDSGGVVYSYISSTGARLTLGIHKGRHAGYAHFIKANEINSALGTTRY
ncbi:streptogrisin B [Tissierella praeacuta]|uniref:S1 family peptidase n=1 Tax=Tissierella praeacuta TaxID=43131 RepID=UPI001048AA39|nr:S1 family peptidase [Tissierella praeacuta]TCU64856.1 streptogrisin B [Tissierella praeacuta]